MPRVLRAYVPTCRSAFQHLSQIALPNTGDIIKLNVPLLPHRRIWAWGWSSSPPWSMQLTLIGLLRNLTVYEQVLMQWSSATQGWYSGIGQVTAFIGAVNEQIFTSVGGTLFAVSPWRLNLTCDQIGLRIDSVTGVAALFDFGLHVTSQQGI